MLAFSSISFALMGLIVHSISLSFWTLAFARSFVIIVSLLPFVLKKDLPLLGKEPAWLLLRSVAGTCALLAFFYALRNISLADATLLTYSNPVWVALFAPFLLKEAFQKERSWAILLGLVGLILILGPTGNWLTLGGLAGAFAGLGSGIAYIAVRRLRRDHPFTIVLHFAVLSLLATLPGLFLTGTMPVGLQWIGLLFVGLFALSGQWFMTIGYRYVEASAGAPINFLTPVLAQVFSALIFLEPLGGFQIIGGTLIIATGIYLSRKEASRRSALNKPANKSLQE